MKAIYFDMDGTIANLYGVDGWLDDLKQYSVRPYVEAKPLLSLALLARLLNRLQANGYIIGIISWCARNSNEIFNNATAQAKREWLENHMPSVEWNEIHIVEYGTAKSSVAEIKDGILFDDEELNRTEWQGTAYGVDSIIQRLKELL